MTTPKPLATPLHHVSFYSPKGRILALGVGLHTVGSGPKIDRGYLCVWRDPLHLQSNTSLNLLKGGVWRTAWYGRLFRAAGAEPSAGSSGECTAGRVARCVDFWAGLYLCFSKDSRNKCKSGFLETLGTLHPRASPT